MTDRIIPLTGGTRNLSMSGPAAVDSFPAPLYPCRPLSCKRVKVSEESKTNPEEIRFPVQTVRGVKDVLPTDSHRWQQLEAICRKVFARYGFAEIRVPIFEVTALFARTIGAETDIVEKEMYSFTDRGGQSLSLRPEGTAGVIRAYIQSGMQRDAISRLYYVGPMFRHERPQAGRLRQFHQVGLEILGAEGPAADVEVLTLMADLFDALQIPDLTLEINSIGCPDCRPAYIKTLQKSIAGVVDALCSNCQRRKDTNPLRVLDCKVDHCRAATADAPVITEHLCGVCEEHFGAVKKGLSGLSIGYQINPRMVRGLDYYSRTAFEWTTQNLGAQNTVAAGGRYDRLVEQLGGQKKPGIGFALGVERLLLLTPETEAPRPDLFAALLGEAAETAALPLLRALRQQGVSVERAYDGGSLKSQMKKANKSRARFCLIVGEDEIAKGRYMLKDMDAGEQEEIAVDGAVEAIASEVKG